MNLNGKKVYRDINEVIEATIEVPKKYWELEELMRDKPNFDKFPGARKIYQRKEYVIYQVKYGYIVHNTKKHFEEGHTHIHTFNKAKSLIDLAVRKKLPNTPRKWEIESLIRIVKDEVYKDRLRSLLEAIK